MKTLPNAGSVPLGDDKEKIYKTIQERQLCSIANNTKWNRLIDTIREWDGWHPSYRFKTVGNYISGWDVEWYYHLPFPFLCVEWFDIGLYEEVYIGQLVKNKIIDHTKEITHLLDLCKLEYEVFDDIVRVWGYLPKTYDML